MAILISLRLIASNNFMPLRASSVLREASMTMESEYEMPIVLPMTQGTWYQFIFIDDPT